MHRTFRLCAALLTLTLISCSGVFKRPGEQEPVGKASQTQASFYYTGGNRAPANLNPPEVADLSQSSIDPLYLRVKADYHFTLAEAYSLDSNPARAIEEYKLVLVYDPKSALVRVRLAAEFLKKGLVSEAMEQAEEGVNLDPSSALSRNLLASLYSAVKMFDKALEQYREIAKLTPQDVEPHLFIGALYAEMGKYEESIKYFEKVATTAPEAQKHLVSFYVGKIYSEMKDDVKALQSYEKSLKQKPDFIEAVLALGAQHEKQNNLDRAIKLYHSYQERFGPTDRVAEPLARIYMEKQDYEKALKQYQIVSEADPENLNARVKMALILIEQKNFRTAISTLREILTIAPESDRIRFYLGAVYEELKEYPDAIEQFQQIPTASSFFEEAIVHAAYLHKVQGDIPKAIELLEQGIQKRKDISQFFALYAAFLDEIKEHKRAATLLTQAVVEFPSNEQLHFFLGSIHDKLGDRQSTISSMRKVISLNENHAQALNYLAYTLAEMDKDLSEAESLARRAVKLKTDDAYIRDTLGWVYYKQGKFNEAVKELEEAHRMKSSESVIAEHLGDAYFSVDLAGRARDMYELAIRTETEANTIEKIEAKIRAIERAQNMKGRLPASFSKDSSPRVDQRQADSKEAPAEREK